MNKIKTLGCAALIAFVASAQAEIIEEFSSRVQNSAKYDIYCKVNVMFLKDSHFKVAADSFHRFYTKGNFPFSVTCGKSKKCMESSSKEYRCVKLKARKRTGTFTYRSDLH